MAYRVYFCNCPVLGEPSDIALEDAVPFDFLTEADAITTCGKFLRAGLVFPVALEYPDGTRLSAQQIEDRCSPPPPPESSKSKRKEKRKERG